MKIRNRLTLLFTAITAALMIAFAVIIYFNYAENREDSFHRRIRLDAVTKASMLLNAQVAPKVLQTIYRNTRTAPGQEQVAIYDTDFKLLYHDASNIDFVEETADMLRQIIREKEVSLTQEGKEVIGFLYTHEDKNYIITVAAHDDYGLTKLKNLRLSLVLGLLIAVIVIFLTGRFLARQALSPVSDIVKRVSNITATSLNQRLDEGSGKDEIAELAITFNRMLDRLEKSFEAQRQFVSNISHELRTPLAAIIAELELARSQKRTAEAYETTIDLALQDAKVLSRLSKGLLDLAKASYDTVNISKKKVRLDELLLDARQQVLKANPGYKINILFEADIENEKDITIYGNEYLLKTAFSNLMENGCKFSGNRQCDVSISFDSKYTLLRFADKGVGIPEVEQQQIFKPFFRGSNLSFATGHGIGLSLAQKIFSLHKGKLHLHSVPQQGTTISIRFRHPK
ncbi:HAMP domain-containing sensor histidine kinase [Botryobacter ruber]|uniref:HAMP domain-containing sensor histidine kinase n=1 Tax=Botryobacter ruber TaxID=2171629 RepID=UPI000E0C849A|nr:ATP-binding protein [Botryobacter ruber]